MKFFVALCALATWIYVEGMQFINDELHEHKGEVIDCVGRRIEINQLMKEAICMPRPTLEKLIPQSGYTFYPNYASVMRCSGSCTRNKSCMPVRKNIRNITVRRVGLDLSECYHVAVEDHIKCKCQCSVTRNHCNIHQVYSEDNCACECQNRTECDKARGMVWNEKLCKCTCNKEEEICSSGLEWVPSRCGCAKVMEM
ncbi:PREDICTED: vascular endothelial growth factor A-like [Wasmannia auropunctata]|uniref:vascular endothelial growth factor A-like n=1 Tax=Wasmannia auropunctata TaxID=64793 RepID=UPI0005EF5D83|nr:PREDICTED: vascular endothelial growth factor A-like [Wasmannia auropunctata]